MFSFTGGTCRTILREWTLLPMKQPHKYRTSVTLIRLRNQADTE